MTDHMYDVLLPKPHPDSPDASLPTVPLGPRMECPHCHGAFQPVRPAPSVRYANGKFVQDLPIPEPAEIEKYASQGFTLAHIANAFGIAPDKLNAYMEADDRLMVAYRRGKFIVQQESMKGLQGWTKRSPHVAVFMGKNILDLHDGKREVDVTHTVRLTPAQEAYQKRLDAEKAANVIPVTHEAEKAGATDAEYRPAPPSPPTGDNQPDG